MPFPRTSLAWGQKLTPAERTAVFDTCDRLDVPPDNLMGCMAWESAETFSPKVRNAAGSGATGLIQFMPSTARSMGTTVEKLAAMTFIEQLAYVERYFKPYRGRLRTLSDLYMAILWPRGVGKAESYALFVKGQKPTALYDQNRGLDVNKDGIITKAECTAKVQAKLVRGMLPQFRWSK